VNDPLKTTTPYIWTDIQEGQTISFRMIDAKPGTGVAPHRVSRVDPAENDELERLAPILMARALKEQAAEKAVRRKAKKDRPTRTD
jgi:hypothetical protein